MSKEATSDFCAEGYRKGTKMDLTRARPKKHHPFHWVVEPFAEEPSFNEKSMFGCKGCYLYGRLMLVLAARGREPWKGLLVPTEKRYHEALRRDHTGLVTHPVLKKCLYLPESIEEFEETARALAEAILADDARIGVESNEKSHKTGIQKRRRGTT